MIPSRDPRHGTIQGYWAGCRLGCCREANRLYGAAKKVQRKSRGIPEHVHGTPNGYVNYDCRCTACQIATVGSGGDHVSV